MAFIQFVLSFLVSGDNSTIGQILEIKGSSEIWITSCTVYFSAVCWWDLHFVLFRTPSRDPEHRSEGRQNVHSQSNSVHTENKSRCSTDHFLHLKQIYGFDSIWYLFLVFLQVVLNKTISKTQKVRFFTPAVLANIASLYKWNGIVDATTDDNRVSYFLFVLCWLEQRLWWLNLNFHLWV